MLRRVPQKSTNRKAAAPSRRRSHAPKLSDIERQLIEGEVSRQDNRWNIGEGGKGANTGLFAAIPSWWRGFLFHVLSPSELHVYTYLLTMLGPDQRCIPTDADIMDATGIASRSTVHALRTSLIRKGFFLIERGPAYENKRDHQYIYWRPSPEYTLRTLLDLGLIDADLRAVVPRGSRQPRYRNPQILYWLRRAVEIGLKPFVYAKDLHAYSRAEGAAKMERLTAMLEAASEYRRTRYERKSSEKTDKRKGGRSHKADAVKPKAPLPSGPRPQS